MVLLNTSRPDANAALTAREADVYKQGVKGTRYSRYEEPAFLNKEQVQLWKEAVVLLRLIQFYYMSPRTSQSGNISDI